MATADLLVKMLKNSANSALARASKKSKKVECTLAEEDAAKRIQAEAKQALRDRLEKEERDQRQKAYREKEERNEKEKAEEM